MPNTPTNLAGELIGPPHEGGYTASNDPYSFGLTWTDTNGGAAQTKIYRQDFGDPVVIGTASAGATAFTDPGPLVPNRFYIYRVSAFDGTNESEQTPSEGQVQIICPVPAGP